jgi:hypothetical protein
MTRISKTLILIALGLSVAGVAIAGDHGWFGWRGEHKRGGRGMPAQVPAQYLSECGSCHLAYPPGLLPAVSWQRMMQGLERHYGTDASLDPAVTAELSSWLQANAGTYKRVRGEAPPEDRITLSRWFAHKHDEVAPDVFKRPAIKSAANCAACHEGAQQGDFNEHRVRIPK